MNDRNASTKPKSDPLWWPFGFLFFAVFVALLAAIYWDCPFIQHFEGWEGLIAAGFAGAVAWIVGYRNVHKIGEQIRQAQADAVEARKVAEEQRKAMDRQMRWQTAEWRRELEGRLRHHIEHFGTPRKNFSDAIKSGDGHSVHMFADQIERWFKRALEDLGPRLWNEEIADLRKANDILGGHSRSIDLEKMEMGLPADELATRYAKLQEALDLVHKTLEDRAAELRDYDGSRPIG